MKKSLLNKKNKFMVNSANKHDYQRKNNNLIENKKKSSNENDNRYL